MFPFMMLSSGNAPFGGNMVTSGMLHCIEPAFVEVRNLWLPSASCMLNIQLRGEVIGLSSNLDEKICCNKM